MADCPITERRKNYKHCKICKYHDDSDGCVYWEWSGEYYEHTFKEKNAKPTQTESMEIEKGTKNMSINKEDVVVKVEDVIWKIDSLLNRQKYNSPNGKLFDEAIDIVLNDVRRCVLETMPKFEVCLPIMGIVNWGEK